MSLCFSNGMAGLIYHLTELSGKLRDHLSTLCPSRDGKEAHRGQGPQSLLPRPHRKSEEQASGFLATSPSSSHCTTLPTLGPGGLPLTWFLTKCLILCVRKCVSHSDAGVSWPLPGLGPCPGSLGSCEIKCTRLRGHPTCDCVLDCSGSGPRASL